MMFSWSAPGSVLSAAWSASVVWPVSVCQTLDTANTLELAPLIRPTQDRPKCTWQSLCPPATISTSPKRCLTVAVAATPLWVHVCHAAVPPTLQLLADCDSQGRAAAALYFDYLLQPPTHPIVRARYCTRSTLSLLKLVCLVPCKSPLPKYGHDSGQFGPMAGEQGLAVFGA